MEEWRQHPTLQVEVSNEGAFRWEGAHISTYTEGDGYQVVHLRSDSKVRTYSAHKLVIETFQGPKPFPSAQCRHLNGVRSDNRTVNLKWGTPKENAEDRTRHGNTPTGEQHPMVRLTDEQVVELRQLRFDGASLVELAEKFDCAACTVSAIARGRIRKKQGGPITTRLFHFDARSRAA